MNDPVSNAIDHIRSRCPQGTADGGFHVTLNFHPDLIVAGSTVIDRLASDGVYRSQFETGTSNGGLTAFRDGDRWNWESRIFGGAYDNAAPSLRPKYGSLNHLHDPVGGSRRFGSAHFRLRPHVRARVSFSYPDSYLNPQNFAVGDASHLVALANANQLSLDPWLDNYIEAHIHGPLVIDRDIEALVLDPSFRGSRLEEKAQTLGCEIEWHAGFRLPVHQSKECQKYRGPDAADAIVHLAESGYITPARLSQARETELDYQTAKWVWHCMARFGYQQPSDGD